jgi:hypothetical protein
MVACHHQRSLSQIWEKSKSVRILDPTLSQQRLNIVAGIGKRLFQKPSSLEKARDVQAVCCLARCLLEDEETTSVHGTIGLLAEDFAGAPATVTADELLQVSICSDNPVSFV